MYRAYADHRPFTVSPDIVWLLICQGFAEHCSNSSETLRRMIVSHTGNVFSQPVDTVMSNLAHVPSVTIYSGTHRVRKQNGQLSVQPR